jgi:hypothetical protein
LGPMMQRSSPGAISRFRPLMALKPSKLTCTSSSRDSAVGHIHFAGQGRARLALRPPDSVRSAASRCW